MIGKSLSHYNIVEELGRGGMGIVYKAEDTKLDRMVAIKVLPSAALANEDDRERFYREAKAAAQLHHPHIASVFEIDEAVPSDAPHGTEPSPFIAMEFVDGGTLRSDIEKGPMPLKEAVRIASQVAEALKLAHSKDIVHRDIKSYNVMLTSDGDAKVLDFGLAKTAQSTMLTRMGSTLGTVAYMSPEQARGDEVDHRSDIWSLGIMLFEMVAGRLPFSGEYEKAVMYGILNEMPPPLTSLRTGVPMGLEWIVSKCLAKAPNERYQACADLIVDLKTVDLSATGLSRQSTTISGLSDVSTSQGSVNIQIPFKWLWLLLLPLGIAIGWFLSGSGGPSFIGDSPARSFSLVVRDASFFLSPLVTSDGQLMVGTLVDTDGSQIASVNLRSGGVNTIVPDAGSNSMSLSQDDQWIAFQSSGTLYRVRLQGGTPIQIMDASVLRGSAWTSTGDLIVARQSREGVELVTVPADGGEHTVLLRPDSTRSDLGFLYPISMRERSSILATMIDAQSVYHSVIVDIETGDYSKIGVGSPVAYLESGHLLYFENDDYAGRLLVRPFDIKRLEFVGPPSMVEENAERRRITVDDFGSYYSETLAGGIQAAAFDGILYVNGVIADEINIELPTTTGYQPRLSPDGKRVMLRMRVENHEELHEYNFERGTMREFTTTSDGDADNAAYSSDGSELIFELNNKMYRRNANGSGATVEIPTADGTSSMDWARSGEWIVHNAENVNGFSELYKIDVQSGESELLDGGEGTHGWPRISPDERFISYSTTSSIGRSVWVLSLEDGNRFKIADEARSYLTAWSRDGKYLFYNGAAGLYRVPITLDPFFEVTGVAERIIGSELREFDVVSNGDSVFAITIPSSDAVANAVTFTVITDWMNELRQIAPPVE